MHLEQGGAVLVVVRMHGTQQAELIGDGGGVRQQIGNRESGLTTRPHRDVGAEGEESCCAVVTMLLRQRRVHRLAVLLLNERLWIKEVHLRGAAGHEEEDDPLRPRLNHRSAHSERIGCCIQQTMQGHRAKARASLAQPGAAGGGER